MPQEFRASLTASIPMGSDAMNAMPEISKALETAKAALEKIGGLTVATNTAVVNSRGPRAKAAPAAAEPAAGGGDGDGDTLTHVDEGNVTAAPWATQASKAAGG
ncbi:MAG TPA: hypothetical protein VIR45_14030 [Kiloniellaceae bacterium]